MRLRTSRVTCFRVLGGFAAAVGHEIVQRDAVQFREFAQHGNVGDALTALPLRNCLIRIIQFFRELQLRQIRRLAANPPRFPRDNRFE